MEDYSTGPDRPTRLPPGEDRWAAIEKGVAP